jgi:DNA-binding NtrC family response regulator
MLIGQSNQIMTAKKLVREIANTEENALIIGETGTGKKHAAQEIHKRSKQKNRPFVILNCTAVGDTITEQELFGEKKESPHNIERKLGILEQAKRGILYLENVHELKSDFQVKIVNILKEKKFKRMKENEFIPVDFRVIAATTDISLIKNDSFRKDLLALLSPFTIQLPPLRDRRQDIPMLLIHFIQQYCEEYGRETPPIASELFESFIENDWHGNILEMQNAVRNLVLMSPDGALSIEYLPFEVKRHPFEFLKDRDLPAAVSEVEKYIIKKALQKFAGNQTKAAHALNVSEAALRYKMKKYGLTRKAF